MQLSTSFKAADHGGGGGFAGLAAIPPSLLTHLVGDADAIAITTDRKRPAGRGEEFSYRYRR